MSEARDQQPEEAPIDGPELPSLPDGGLSANMPAWLRRAPSFAVAPVEPVAPSPPPGPAFDPGSLTSGLELPEWLDELSERVAGAPIEVRAIPQAERVVVTIEPEATVPMDEAETIAETPVVEVPKPTPIPALTDPTEIQPIAEPVNEPPYRTIATVVIVVAAALLFIALWSVLT